MNQAIFIALTGAGINAANDLIYRKAAINDKGNSIYLFYFISSVSSALLALIFCFIQNGYFLFDITDMLFGLILGVLSFTAYILFLFTFKGSSASITVTIYRLNLIPGIVLAVLFLGEAVTLRKGVGILLCVATTLLFSGKANIDDKKYFYLSIVACLVCGVLNMMNKVAVLKGVDSFSMLFWRFTVVSIISGAILLKKKPEVYKSKALISPALSGLLLMLSVFCTLSALKIGDVSVVIPITQMSFVFVATISWVAFKESINIRKIIGIFCSIAAIILIGG